MTTTTIDAEQLVLGDLLNHVLDKGVVISGTVTISIADIDLLVLDLRLLLTSIETSMRHGIDRTMTRLTATRRRDDDARICTACFRDEHARRVPPGLSGIDGARGARAAGRRAGRVGERRRARRAGVDRRGARARRRRRSCARDRSRRRCRRASASDSPTTTPASRRSRRHADSVESLLAAMQGFVEMTLIITPSTRRMVRELVPVLPEMVEPDVQGSAAAISRRCGRARRRPARCAGTGRARHSD